MLRALMRGRVKSGLRALQRGVSRVSCGHNMSHVANGEWHVEHGGCHVSLGVGRVSLGVRVARVTWRVASGAQCVAWHVP